MSSLNFNAIRMSSIKNFLKYDFIILVFFTAVVIFTQPNIITINPEDLINIPELKKLSLKIRDTNLLLCCMLEK